MQGVAGLVLRKEFVEAAELLKKCTAGLDKSWPMSMHEMTAALYYLLAQMRGERGAHPDREHESYCSVRDLMASILLQHYIAASTLCYQQQFADHFVLRTMHYALQEHTGNGCTPLDEETIAFIMEFAHPTLHFLYERTPVELQLLCNLHDWSLIFTKPESHVNRPAFALVANARTKAAVLVIRGTNSIHDVVTDIK
eukprot:17351-Heterococcus_DN1.PRE.1